MNTNIINDEIISRRQTLTRMSALLKQRFVGLDNIIDEITRLLTPWFLFPESQLRPTVINLWGLTGSGKTALIRTIIDLLECRRLYSHIDMGEYESDSAAWLKDVFTDDLDFFNGKPAVICLDEFQFARTLDNNGHELGKDKLRVVWELLDTGKIEYVPGRSTYYLFRADNCLKRVERLIRNDVLLEAGEVVHGIEVFMKVFDGFYFESIDRNGVAMDKAYFLSDDFTDGMCALINNDDYSKAQISDLVRGASLKELKHFIVESMKSRPATSELDLSRSLIFILGNLDEAFRMSRNVNPDLSADEFHEATSKITVADIKRALRKRFRAEQIARLGNNHIIYKSFNSAQFRELINRELETLAKFLKEKFGWSVYFDKSVAEIVYAEGVYPTQGTRPVYTTVKNLVESRIGNLVVSIIESGKKVSQISWSYVDQRFIYNAHDESSQMVLTFSDDVELKLENLRKSVDPELQASTAVHESAHAILAALTFRIIPSTVVSRTASESEGFCMVNFPEGPMTRESLKKDIIMTLGGYVAEKIVFGEEFTSSGVYHDIEEASRLANKAVRRYAMGSDPIHIAVESCENEDLFYVSQKNHAEAIALIKSCEEIAFEILERNKLLLLKMAEYLTVNSRMDGPLIETFVRKYGNEKWIAETGFVKKENYYQFDRTVKEQLSKLETDSVNLLIDGALRVENDAVPKLELPEFNK